MPLYPSLIYDRGEELLRALGTFWSEIFDDSEKLKEMYRGYMIEAGQTGQYYYEAKQAVSRFTIPLYHTENWYFLTFKSSEVSVATLKYGDGGAYGPQPTNLLAAVNTVFRYGISYRGSRDFVDGPDTLRRSRQMFNRITDPSLTYIEGMDYQIDNTAGMVYFRENPLSTGLLPTRDIIDPDTGEVSDVEVGIWLYRADFDLEYIWTQFGYVIGAQLPTSQYYKDFVNARWDTTVAAPALKSLEETMGAITGVPFAKVEETVEVIIETADKKQVVTDKNVYTFPSTAEIVVSVGDELIPGQTMSDVFSIIELGSGIPSAEILPSVALGTSFLKGGYTSELVFENKSVTIDYLGIDEDNKAIITFEVSGLEDDVELFWATVYEEGREAGKALSEWFDTRTDPVGPPLPNDLPKTINPMEFVLDQIMGNNIFIIKLRPDKFAEGAIGLGYMERLRHILPPQTTYIVYIEITADSEYIEPTSPGTETTPGAEELFEGYQGPDPLEDSVTVYGDADSSEGWVRELALIIREVGGQC